MFRNSKEVLKTTVVLFSFLAIVLGLIWRSAVDMAQSNHESSLEVIAIIDRLEDDLRALGMSDDQVRAITHSQDKLRQQWIGNVRTTTQSIHMLISTLFIVILCPLTFLIGSIKAQVKKLADRDIKQRLDNP